MFPTGQTTVDVIRTIILTQLNSSVPNMNFDDRIVIYNQEFIIPTDEHLRIEIGFRGSKVYGSNNYAEVNNGVFQEIQDLYTQEQIAVLVYSHNLEAIRYKELVVMALKSIYAQQLMEQYSFYIAPKIQIQNLSQLEGGSINYRFDLFLTCMVAYENVLTPGYLNNFETQVVASNKSLTVQETFHPAILP
jgi:hypothetical protein